MRVAIVGATGAVGQELLALFVERDFSLYRADVVRVGTFCWENARLRG